MLLLLLLLSIQQTENDFSHIRCSILHLHMFFFFYINSLSLSLSGVFVFSLWLTCFHLLWLHLQTLLYFSQSHFSSMWRVEFCFSSFSRVGGLCHRRKVVQSLLAVADDYLVLICSNCVAATEALWSFWFVSRIGIESLFYCRRDCNTTLWSLFTGASSLSALTSFYRAFFKFSQKKNYKKILVNEK